MDDKVGGLEVKHVFNREKSEKTSPFHETQNKDIHNLLERNTSFKESDKSHDRPLKKRKSDGKCIEPGAAWGFEKMTDISSMKFTVDKADEIKVGKHPERNTTDANSLEASRTFGTTEDRKKCKISAKQTLDDDLEGKKSKKTRVDGSFKVPHGKIGVNTNVKDLVPISEGILKSGIALDTRGNNKISSYNKVAKEEQFGQSKRELYSTKSLKVSALSTNKDKKNAYREFVVSPKPNAETRCGFSRPPWEDRLKKAYDEGTAIVLHNVDPDYSSRVVEVIIRHAFKVNCDAKILQRTLVSSPHYAQAFIVLETKEAAQRILTKLDEECLMLSDGRKRFMPLVGTLCPPISTKKSSSFFGHLPVGKARFQNQHEDEAVSTSHFPLPNTIEYDMAMEWRLQQLRSMKCWEKFHEQKWLELEKLRNDLQKKCG